MKNIFDMTPEEMAAAAELVDGLANVDVFRMADEFLNSMPPQDFPAGEIDMAGPAYEDYIASVYEDDDED